MTERPILFSAPMVRAILDGRKTQTRRIVKPQPTITALDDGRYDAAWGGRFALGCSTPGECLSPWSPYGQPDDRLWVRETFSEFDTLNGMVCWYKAESDDPDYWHNVTWRPSIHMPRRLSRITLEITGVRVERLQEISEADAEAEGCTADPCDGPTFYDDFASLWRRINGPDSWAANPWVWVISFKRVTP
ncbi:MAG: hypothetical protein K8F32_08535 [Rhodocyclaceae bacterium]|nr:hypothetical protein [Rhodocyclaceae bacterium]